MSIDNLLFLHPLLGADDAWAGYLAESIPGSDAAPALEKLCRDPLLKDFDRRQPWFIPAEASQVADCTSDNAIYVFPSHLSETQKANEAELRQARRKLALLAAPDEKLPAPGTWDYALIDLSQARTLPPYALMGLSSRTIVVGTGVHSHADQDWARANACSLITTEFLQSRNANGKKADLTRVKLLEMLALIAEDADTSAIEAIFKQEPKLSYSLLRLVNSAAIAPRNPITSFGQAINLLGRRQLQRWLQLLVYADPNNAQKPNPLLLKAAARGRLLELLAPKLQPAPDVENIEDAAFMVGVFSLLDVLLNMSMAEILQQLPLADAVSSALSEYAGSLGAALHVIEAAERRELKAAANRLLRTSIDGESYLKAQLAALNWTTKIRPVA
jgi:hypothetical protein